MSPKVPFDHPFRSDKDGLIYELRSQIDRLASENVRLESINRGEKRRRLRKFCVWAVLSVFATTMSFGIVAIGYSAFRDDIYLGKQCAILCNHVLGHISMHGDETTFGGCNEAFRHCQCRLLSGNKVTIGPIAEDELRGDLKKTAKKFDFASWRRCANSGSTVTDIVCGKVPKEDD